jgi:hypothetical protein
VPAGLNAALTKQSIDITCGDAAQALNRAFLDVEAAKRFLDPAQDEDLIALGYTAEDVATLRSAMADLDQLRRVFAGAEEVTPAKDFRVFAQRIWGTGFIEGR